MNAIRSFFKPPTKPPILLSLRSSTWFITSTVCTAVFTDIFLYAVIVPVFPFSLVARIGVPESSVQHWLSVLLSVYGAALLVSAPIFGWLSDRIEFRRGPLLAGMIVLGGSTVMLCLARNLALLIVGRVLQGASAGVVWVVGLALLADTVERENAGLAMGFVSMAYSIAALLAPLLGGIVYERAGYYAVFSMAFGMIALDIVLRILLIEKKAARRWLVVEEDREMQRGGSVEVQDEHEDEKNIAGAVSPSGADAAALDDATAAPTPIKKALPPMLILLKSRRMQAVFAACTIAALILTSFDTTLPLFVEENFHWTSLGAGLIFLAPLCPSFIQPVYGRAIDRYGARWPAAVGLLICVPPFVCFRFVTHNSMSQKVLLCALLAIIGLGIALTLAATMAEFTYIAAEKERRQPGSMGKGGAYAQSYSLFNVSWALGSLIGAYWSGGIRQAAGFGAMGWSLALLCGVFCVPVSMFVGGSIFGRRKRDSDKDTCARAAES
ncbi:hypothetical protein PMZ80_009561 [Knufia obscura]|uniref:Major facilitator superfamily (MFS) profile domain-containing protein n=1 Tax=Knufia obscura TaxID=1635080 RepID=A0ABR0RCM1_9EURO|nr:hypothetical protein PMZ80_009561 [Knufia obscura]